TGIFDDDRYFDVFVEYAKAAPDDILIRISATNRGAEAAALHLLPTLWFKNDWSWFLDRPKPRIGVAHLDEKRFALSARDDRVAYWLHGSAAEDLLFTENETNMKRLFGAPNASPFVKDAFHEYVVHGRRDAVNENRTGTKAAAHFNRVVDPG